MRVLRRQQDCHLIEQKFFSSDGRSAWLFQKDPCEDKHGKCHRRRWCSCFQKQCYPCYDRTRVRLSDDNIRSNNLLRNTNSLLWRSHRDRLLFGKCHDRRSDEGNLHPLLGLVQHTWTQRRTKRWVISWGQVACSQVCRSRTELFEQDSASLRTWMQRKNDGKQNRVQVHLKRLDETRRGGFTEAREAWLKEEWNAELNNASLFWKGVAVHFAGVYTECTTQNMEQTGDQNCRELKHDLTEYDVLCSIVFFSFIQNALNRSYVLTSWQGNV